LFTKRRIEHGVFLWSPSIEPGETLSLTSTQPSLLIDGVDWQAPEQRWRPAVAG
jgi:transposase